MTYICVSSLFLLMVILAPIIKLSDSSTFSVLKVAPLAMIVVRLQDLISKCTFEFNKTYGDIVSAGGLHDYLNFDGEILLSLIMKDEIIAQFNPRKYSEAINSLMPDSSTTIDGETYEGEYMRSRMELERIQVESEELSGLCHGCSFYGLAKGCTQNQMEGHIAKLRGLGIENFVFHVGDFVRHGDPNLIKKARSYSVIIRKHAKKLVLYGMGSQRRMLQFSFADVFVTFNHFVTARNGMRFAGTRKVKYVGTYRPEIVTSNFLQMLRNVDSLGKQTRLN